MFSALIVISVPHQMHANVNIQFHAPQSLELWCMELDKSVSKQIPPYGSEEPASQRPRCHKWEIHYTRKYKGESKLLVLGEQHQLNLLRLTHSVTVSRKIYSKWCPYPPDWKQPIQDSIGNCPLGDFPLFLSLFLSTEGTQEGWGVVIGFSSDLLQSGIF